MKKEENVILFKHVYLFYFQNLCCSFIHSQGFSLSFLPRLSRPHQRDERRRVYFLLFVIHVLFMFTLEQEQSVAIRIHRVSVWCIISIKCISFSLEKVEYEENRKTVIWDDHFTVSFTLPFSLLSHHTVSIPFPFSFLYKRPSITSTNNGSVCDTYSREIEGNVVSRETDRWSSRVVHPRVLDKQMTRWYCL